MLKDIVVVVPAFNAGKTIEQVFARIPKEVLPGVRRYIVVDDGSTDNTLAVLRRIGRRFPNLDILKHSKNRGYGAAEKTLLHAAMERGVDVAILLHSDGQYSPEKIPDLLDPFQQDKADIVQGSRMLGGGALKGGMPVYKYVANKCLTVVENLAFGMNLAEYHSGYMAYSKKALETIPFNRLSDSFDFDLEMIVMAKILGLRIQEVAIPTIYADEVSHLNPVKYGFDVLAVVRRYLGGTYHALAGLSRGRGKKEIAG